MTRLALVAALLLAFLLPPAARGDEIPAALKAELLGPCAMFGAEVIKHRTDDQRVWVQGLTVRKQSACLSGQEIGASVARSSLGPCETDAQDERIQTTRGNHATDGG